MSGGQASQAALVLPATTVAGARVPLVIGLHPSGGTGQSFGEDTGLVSAATTKGFAVLLPNGALSTDDGKGHYWNIPGVPLVSGAEVPPGTRDDLRFLADAIDRAVADHCIDARRGLCHRLFGRRATDLDGGVPNGRPRRGRCARRGPTGGPRSR